MTHNDTLRTKINQETARFPWQDLLKYFATGAVIMVSDQLDLVEVGYQISTDNTDLVQQWLSQGLVAKVNDAQAQTWLDQNTSLWTVVVKPWILVQERTTNFAQLN